MKITDIRTIPLSYRVANPSMSAASFNAAADRADALSPVVW